MSNGVDYPLEETIHFLFTTRAFATGIPTTLAGTPVLSIYEDESVTQITAGVSVGADHDSVTGLNLGTVVATAANGYESGKSYHLVITTGTVSSVSVVGEVVGHFTINRAAALRPATIGRTLVVDAAGLADANTVKLGPSGSGTAQTANDNGADLATITGPNGVTLATAQGNYAPAVAGDDMGIDAGGVDAIWDEASGDHVGAGSVGLVITSTLGDTAELQGDWVDGGRLDLILDAVLADTNELQSDDVPGLIAALNDPTAAAVADAVWDEAVAGHVAGGSFGATDAAILADTNELQADWANAGRLDAILDARASQTTADAIETDTQDIQSRLPAALVNSRMDASVDGTGMEAGAVTNILTTQMTEAYAANGVAPTLAQAQFAIHQMLQQFGIAGTSLTVRKLDNTTTAFVVTLDDGTSPTDAKRV